MHWAEAALRLKKAEAEKQLSAASGQDVTRAVLAVPSMASMQCTQRTLERAHRAGFSQVQLVSQHLAVAVGFASQRHRWDWGRLLVLDAGPDAVCASLVALEDAAHFRVLASDRERYASDALLPEESPEGPEEEAAAALIDGAVRRLLGRCTRLLPHEGDNSSDGAMSSLGLALVTGARSAQLAQALALHSPFKRRQITAVGSLLDAARMAAEGAALVGMWRLREANEHNNKTPTARDVLPFAVECHYTEADSRHTLFECHSAFPCERRINFFTALDGQRQFRFEFFEQIGDDAGEGSRAAEPLCVGGLDEARAGVVSVHLRLRIDHNGASRCLFRC